MPNFSSDGSNEILKHDTARANRADSLINKGGTGISIEEIIKGLGDNELKKFIADKFNQTGEPVLENPDQTKKVEEQEAEIGE